MAGRKRMSATFKLGQNMHLLSCTALLMITLITLAYNFNPLPASTVRHQPLPVQVHHKRSEAQPRQEPKQLQQRQKAQVSSARKPNSQNILCIFTGRWEYLRVNFAYVYRNLRKNGGVLDKVYYYMIMYNRQTLSKLTELTKTANKILGETVFEFRFRNHKRNTAARPKGIFGAFVYEIFDEMARHPERKYFKMDDDIVYIHPGTFRQLIEQQNTSECFIHFANIGGANWRCSYIHQEMGIYDNEAINPKKLKFQFSRDGLPKCGWKSAECAAVAMEAFFYHYQNKSLEKLLFDGRYLTPERARFSINFLLMDSNLIDIKAMMESGPILTSDEHWLTVVYSRKVKKPNCVVGRAFVVHFSYFTTLGEINKHDFLPRFETIAYDLVKELPEALQTSLAFNQTLGS
ncbi:uncharacterized protein LOC119724683 isoform X2 [Patiria miniata]|uniref:Uncharacterized protein n=1 Tax=Patiria miniata TaxID=46514 RepID=A0A913ZKC5_PATMI|nr:uncharacterized protein LOC119724683 isoform X2 [Patiria miniata]